MLEKHGFEVDSVYEREIMMTRSNLEKIGSYAGLAAVMVSGYPVKLASEALVSAVAPALETAGMGGVPRYWLEVTARRK